MRLNVHIHKIKSIDDLTIALPVDKGLYAITGQNGSGKSTIVACASRAFFRMKMADYFGAIEDDAFIECELNGITRRWEKKRSDTKNLTDYWAHNDSDGDGLSIPLVSCGRAAQRARHRQ